MSKYRGYNKVNQKGRSKYDSFVQLKRFMVNHVSWLELHPAARVIYIELRNRFNGHNNGEISLSYREAAKVAKCSPDSANRHLKQLIAHGYVKIANKGHFSNRHATTWILTNEKLDDALPTNEWAKWQQQD